MSLKCHPYCTTYCRFEPDYCPPVDCPDGPICIEMIPSDAILFEGTTLECFGVTPGMSLTQVINVLAALVFPECAVTTTTTSTTSTTTTSTTTTECVRPSGLIDLILISAYDDGTGTIHEFTASLIEACDAANYITVNNPFVYSYIGQVGSVTLGESVYDTNFLMDCFYVPDGYYIYTDTLTLIVQVLNGVIESITDCSVTTQPPFGGYQYNVQARFSGCNGTTIPVGTPTTFNIGALLLPIVNPQPTDVYLVHDYPIPGVNTCWYIDVLADAILTDQTYITSIPKDCASCPSIVWPHTLYNSINNTNTIYYSSCGILDLGCFLYQDQALTIPAWTATYCIDPLFITNCFIVGTAFGEITFKY